MADTLMGLVRLLGDLTSEPCPEELSSHTLEKHTEVWILCFRVLGARWREFLPKKRPAPYRLSTLLKPLV